jgi:protein-tyrosine phosphatase
MTLLRDVVFMSQTWAEAMIPASQESIISITDYRALPADLNDGWKAVLRIQFDDVDPDESTPDEFESELIELSDLQAAEIAKFVLENATTSSTLVVHCRFGQSRSPAVAKAVCEHFSLNFPAKFNSHNKFVYRLVSEAISRHSGA